LITANFPVFKWEEDCASRSRALDLSSIPAYFGAFFLLGFCVGQSIGFAQTWRLLLLLLLLLRI
jgi:hypothetical protein